MFLVSLWNQTSSAASYSVGSISELQTRLNAAVAGDEVVMQSGIYTTSASIGIARAGTAAKPILIRAQTVGGVEINGTHGFSFNSGAAYVTVQGFKFTHAASINMTSSAHHCRLTRNIIELNIAVGSDVSYVNISGDDMEVDHNELRNKTTLGNMLDITGSNGQVARRLWVHHNYFHDFASPGGNGAETIRWGLSGLSLSTGAGLCEHNLFVRCDGENEMISNKSSGNTYRYNTVIDAREISQRHGNDCLYYGNYMLNSEGIRVYGDRHKIFNNYFEGNSIGVNMGNGDGDVYNGAALTAHDRPDDNVVVFNTFVNNSTHYQMGGRTGGLGSSNSVVANNIFQGGGSIGGISSSAPYTGSWSNNIRWQTSSAGNMPASAILNINPLLVKDASGAYHIQPGSPAFNSGRAVFDYYGILVSYASITNDMDAQRRDASRDIGADEISGAPAGAHILSTNEVGPFAFSVPFSLSVTPFALVVFKGVATNLTYMVNVTDVVGANTTVVLSVTGVPANASASFTPASVNGSGSTTLSLFTSNNTALGSFPLTITGTAATFTNTTTVTLLVTTNVDVRPESLVARLTFDDDTANDSSGLGNHGTLLNGASVVDDVDRGKVLNLDGTDDYVDLGTDASLDLSDNGQATITAWVKMAAGKNHNSIVTKGEWQDAYSLLIKGDAGDLLWTGNGASVFSSSSIVPNVWTHAAVVINGNAATFYINGQVNGAANQDRGGPIDNNPLDHTEIGREDRSNDGIDARWYFNGRLDDVRIYEAALMQEEILNIMSPPVEPIFMKVAHDGNKLRLSWTGGSGPFQVQMKTNLYDADWQEFGGPIVSNSLTINPSNSICFYRIQLQ